MSFHCKQVSADRWGIYSGTRLLATVSDRATCEAIMANFESGRTKVPNEVLGADKATAAQALSNVTIEAGDIAATPVAEAIAEQTAATIESLTAESLTAESLTAESLSERRPSQVAISMSDDDIAKLLDGKSLKVKELESIVLQAQMRRNR